jgi:hypothetical protein|tara:strand:+ start:1207 stop:1620 length:414 start_codon:yes stop_codon:yes gene_type:complete
MTLIPIDITYNGKPAVVEFEDSLTFGDTEMLIGNSVDLSDVTKPKIDIQKYRLNLLSLTVKKAPFKTGDVNIIKMQDSKIIKSILKEIVKVHPLTTYIEDWMETFMSSEEMTNLDTQSTTIVPPSSVGTKKRSINKK